MTTKPTTETDAADKSETTETDVEHEQTETTEDSETEETDEEEGSQVTPREKELRKLLRENEKELKKLRKAEDERRKSELTETEKLREELSSKEEELSSLRRKAIAAEFGLDDVLADRLRGVTEEDLRADAESLSKLVKPPKPKSKDVGIGAPGADDDAPTDPVEAHRAAMAGRRF